jgi:fumarate hydratase class I
VLKLREGIVELYRKVAVSVPPDVEEAMKAARELLEPGSEAERAVAEMLKGIRASRGKTTPVCEDTGVPVFYVSIPDGISHRQIEATIMEATRIATEKVPLKANAVDVVTGANTGDNTGEGFPVIYTEESAGTNLTIEMILTSPRDENEGRTYKLPVEEIGAKRDLEGVRKCVMDTVTKAGGRGCPPYIIGVGIGASREQAARLSKKQLLRKLSDANPNEILQAMEEQLVRDINGLGIGPLGLGGGLTALGVKLGVYHRHTESYIVDVSLSCWANRRGKLIW